MTVQYAIPSSYVQSADAPNVPPPELQARVYGNTVQLNWQSAGASSYVVNAYDAYSGRSLGVQYRTNQNSININGLPTGTTVELVVQGVNGDAYGQASSVSIEIPAVEGYGYGYGYSPYYGYNSYMPYWYSSYYPIGWYNYWYPGGCCGGMFVQTVVCLGSARLDLRRMGAF